MKNLPVAHKYPKKIFIKSEIYKVVFTKKITHYGDTDPVKRLIRIKAGMSKRETFKTFIHEVLHALDFESNTKLKHKQIYKLEELLFEVLIDNFI